MTNITQKLINITTHCDLTCGHKFTIHSDAWAYLARSSDSSKRIAPNAEKLLAKLRLKLRLSPSGIEMSYDDIRKISLYSDRQNKRLLEQLSNILVFEAKTRATSKSRHAKTKHFLSIKYTEKGEQILEAGRGEGYTADIIHVDFKRGKRIKGDSSQSLTQTPAEAPINSAYLPTSYKEEKIKDKDIAISQASFSNNPNEESEQKIVPMSNYVPKPLEAYHPLIEKDAVELRKRSGREFTLRYINLLLLRLSERLKTHPPSPPYTGMFTKNAAMTYMTERLIREKRESTVTNQENFNFRVKDGSPNAPSKNPAAYLAAIEYSPDIKNVTRIKRRIMSYFNDEQAHDILTNCQWPYFENLENDSRVSIKAPDSVDEAAREKIAKAIRDILGEGVKVTFAKKTEHNTKDIKLKITEPKSELWKKIKPDLIARCGEALYVSFFNGCEAYLGEGIVVVKADSAFKRDVIKERYSHIVDSVIKVHTSIDWVEYEVA